MSSPPNSGQALLSFHLGPVQPFIEAAKTTRDLWAGSYILSWMTVAGLRPLLTRQEGDVDIISPSIQGNPVVEAYFAANPQHKVHPKFRFTGNSDERLLPCLPNRFLAKVPADASKELCDAVKKAVSEEWESVAQAVFTKLTQQLGKIDTAWGRLWPEQVRDYFEARVVAVSYEGRSWDKQFELVGAAMDAVRSVRHVPTYAPDTADVPQKCTLLGTYEQMGPATLRESKAFWRNAAVGKSKAGTRGASVRPRERLCAISLVKRFAWPHYFAPKIKGNVPLNHFLERLKFTDTATVAARRWLDDLFPPDFDTWREEQDEEWSGHWLHWRERVPRAPRKDADGEPEEAPEPACPEEVWNAILRRKRSHGKPPTYFAVLMLDGDGLGKLLSGDGTADIWGQPDDRPNAISGALTGFALKEVRRIVEVIFRGELVYSGGDDTLAVCPADDALALADALRKAYSAAMKQASTLTCGIAVVHYKEDLRVALQQAREAEKRAKNGGRNRLGLTVCRRSGEHTTADCSWDQAEKLNQLVHQYVTTDVSDRWSYKFRELLPSLGGLTRGLVEDELKRLLGRLDGGKADDRERVTELAKELFKKQMTQFDERIAHSRKERPPATAEEDDRQRRKLFAEAVEGFTIVVQSASFLARGRDQ